MEIMMILNIFDSKLSLMNIGLFGAERIKMCNFATNEKYLSKITVLQLFIPCFPCVPWLKILIVKRRKDYARF